MAAHGCLHDAGGAEGQRRPERLVLAAAQRDDHLEDAGELRRGLLGADVLGHAERRKQLEARVRAELTDKLPDDLFEAQQIIDREVAERVRSAGADNFSRVVGELERAGYLTRFYQGYRKNHQNRGGLRNLVCVLDPDVNAALRRRDQLI